MRRIFLTCVVAGVLSLAVEARASIIFQDDFESGTMANWTNAAGSVDISADRNKVPDGGQFSAYLNVSTDGAYHNLGAPLGGPSTFSFWMYDGTQPRAYGEVRSYAGGAYGSGTLVQLFAIGRYHSSMDVTKYQARILYGTGQTGWFNLSDGPARSEGWHNFAIERLADGTSINFYVDGILARSVTGATAGAWDSVLISSVRAGTTAGDAWYDGVEVTDTLVPEPSTLGLLGLGAIGLLARRRK